MLTERFILLTPKPGLKEILFLALEKHGFTFSNHEGSINLYKDGYDIEHWMIYYEYEPDYIEQLFKEYAQKIVPVLGEKPFVHSFSYSLSRSLDILREVMDIIATEIELQNLNAEIIVEDSSEGVFYFFDEFNQLRKERKIWLFM
jgi:hypothetical protein